MLPLVLWTFVSMTGRDVLGEWASSIRMPKATRAKLDQALDRLGQLPFEKAIHTHLLAPVARERHIYKLRVNGHVAVRIMLCRGPLRAEDAYTLLVGAVERDGRLDPPDAPRKAANRLEEVLRHPSERRKLYEGLGEGTA